MNLVSCIEGISKKEQEIMDRIRFEMQYFKIPHSEGTRVDKMTNLWQWITERERERERGGISIDTCLSQGKGWGAYRCNINNRRLACPLKYTLLLFPAGINKISQLSFCHLGPRIGPRGIPMALAPWQMRGRGGESRARTHAPSPSFCHGSHDSK